MHWSEIPSLSALRAFEATARHESQSAAARELNVTHAAINQHIRTLERDLGVQLFIKSGRHIMLTDDGTRLYEATNAGFSQIASAVIALRHSREKSSVYITMPPSLHQNWLLRHIGDFWQKHPTIQVHMTASSEVVDLKTGAFDLALRFGRGKYEGLKSKRLDLGGFAIFSGASGRAARGNALAAARWVFSHDAPEFNTEVSNLGVDIDETRHMRFATASEARAAMIGGNGLFVQARAMMDIELRHGIVREIAPLNSDPELGYYAVYNPARLRPAAKVFLDWVVGVGE